MTDIETVHRATLEACARFLGANVEWLEHAIQEHETCGCKAGVLWCCADMRNGRGWSRSCPRGPHRFPEGPNENLSQCATYIVVGNDHVHRLKSIWDRAHTIEHLPFLYSRAMNGSPNFVAVWSGR